MPSRTHLISSRLAARTGARQVEAVIQSDRAALAVDRAIGSLWRELIAILKDDRGIAINYKRALAILRRIRPVTQRVILERLRKLAAWGHRSAAELLVQTLPVEYLRAAAPIPAEAAEARSWVSGLNLSLVETGSPRDQAPVGAPAAGSIPALRAAAPVPAEAIESNDLSGYFDEATQTWVAVGFRMDQNTTVSVEQAGVAPSWHGAGGPIHGGMPLADDQRGGPAAPLREVDEPAEPADENNHELHDLGIGHHFHDERHSHPAVLAGQTIAASGGGQFSKGDCTYGGGSPQAAPAILTEAGEPAEPAPSEDELRALYQQLIFPPPSQSIVDRILFAPSGGRTWQDRVASLTRLAQPEQLASILASGMAAGKSQREIANDLLPAVNNVRSSARRIARTEGLRVAHAVQMDAHEQLGDLKIGYQIRAQLDQNTRPWHASRSGTIYYDQPTATQKGPAQRPNPPEEALDPSERPAGTPQLAHNCRCSLSPVLAPPPEIADDPAKLAVFQNNAGSVIPDPADYAEWFSTADQRRRRIAVGSRRYDVVAGNLSDLRVPEWDDFLDPDTGDLVSLSRLKSESAAERAERTAKAKALIAERARLIRTTSTFGFLPS